MAVEVVSCTDSLEILTGWRHIRAGGGSAGDMLTDCNELLSDSYQH